MVKTTKPDCRGKGQIQVSSCWAWYCPNCSGIFITRSVADKLVISGLIKARCKCKQGAVIYAKYFMRLAEFFKHAIGFAVIEGNKTQRNMMVSKTLNFKIKSPG